MGRRTELVNAGMRFDMQGHRHIWDTPHPSFQLYLDLLPRTELYPAHPRGIIAAMRQNTWIGAVGRAGLRLAIASALAASLGGCFTYSPGRVDAAASAPLPAEAWPPRDIDAVREFHDATPRQVFRYALRPGATLAEIDPRYAPYVEEKPDFTVLECRLCGQGLLRRYTDHRDTDELLFAVEVAYGFEPNAAFLTSRTLARPQVQERLAEARDEAAADDGLLKFAAPGLRLTNTARRIALDEGMSMRLPTEVAADPPGVLIHFTALFGTPYERAVVDELRERGWVVLSISSEVSITPPPRDVHAARLAELNARRDALIAEIVHLGAPGGREINPESRPPDERQRELEAVMREAAMLERGSFQVCDESQVEPVAEAIAAAVDDVIADHAYAAESALEFAHAEFPQLRGEPIAVIGFSAGSLAAPAAAARLGEMVDAVVLIGSGANLFEIARAGKLTDGGLRVRCEDDAVPADLMDRLGEAYLARSSLDPYHVAPNLRAAPVLLVTADFDAWVPAATGRLLQERLGAPDRLSHFGGHRTLFHFLPSQADRIAQWLEEAVARKAAAAANGEAAPSLPLTP
jgi:hypothetical protein